MRETREAFLAEIRENLDDDTPRLVFADWLEDNGDADRAEFIRAQIRLEAMPEWEAERFDLEERSLDLLSTHWDEWTAGLPEGARQAELTFRRGFVGEARIRPEQFLACGDELVEAAPLLRLTLCGLGTRPEELARSQALLGLREMVVHFGLGRRRDEPDELDLTAFFREWRPRCLRRLDLSVSHMGCSVRGPIDWPGYQQLESLSLDGMDMNDGEVAALLTLPGWGELRRLEIHGQELGEQSVLAACRHDRVSELALFVDGTPRDAQAFTSNDWKRLDSLTLCGLQTHKEELQAMTMAPWFSQLRSLVINGTPFNASAVLSATPPGMRHLKLIRSPNDGDGLAGLLTSEFVGGLTSLELHELVPAEAMADLVTSPRLSELRSLSVSPRSDDYASFSIDLTCGVVESPHLSRLTKLNLVVGDWGLADATRFAGLSGLSRLRALGLWGCRLGEPGIRALARSPHLGTLRRLDIDAKGEGRCLMTLLEAPWLASLRELRFRCDGVVDNDLKVFASSPAVSRLRVLHLGPQPITRAGTEALANSPYLGGLLWLNVGNHSADDDIYEPLRQRFGGRFVGCF